MPAYTHFNYFGKKLLRLLLHPFLGLAFMQYTCTQIKNFWKELQLRLETIGIDNDNSLSSTDILFGKYKQVKYDLRNKITLYAKYYIHKQYVAIRRVNVTNFINLYKQTLHMEKERILRETYFICFTIVLVNLLYCSWKTPNSF